MIKNNSRKRHSPGSFSELNIVPFKRFHPEKREQDSLSSLPDAVIMRILSFLNMTDVGEVSQVNRKLRTASLTWLTSSQSVPIVFPFFTPTLTSPLEDSAPANKLFLMINDKFYLAPVTRSWPASSFRDLGTLFKKTTSLMPTGSRVLMACDFLSRVEIPMISNPNYVQARQLVFWISSFFHRLMTGWSEAATREAARVIIEYLRKTKLETVLESSYNIGSCPGTEILYKHFFSQVFNKDVPEADKSRWLEYLLINTSLDAATTAKVLLLMATPSKEEAGHWQYGVQWTDHTEAIPATQGVATSRYSRLVSLITLLQSTMFSTHLPDILLAVFTTPSPWLPENIGSVLLLLGPEVTCLYLSHLCRGCVNCLNKSVTAALVGLSIMVLRFHGTAASFEELAFSRMKECLMLVRDELREGLVTAVWQGFADEVADLKQAAAQGEEWAQEGGNFLFTAIQFMGKLMMMKAFSVDDQRSNIEP